MGFTLVNHGGSGSVKDNAISTYSYSEDVTSLEPSSIAGGTSQVSVSALAVEENTVGTTHPNSNLLVNNKMTLTDDKHGSVDFQVKKLTNSSGVVSITGDTIMARLNTVATAKPQGGLSGATLMSAIEYYCWLAGVTPLVDEVFAAKLEAVPVNFIGWTGNVWDHIKMLCAGISASTTANIGIEAYVSGDDLYFREAKTSVVDYSDKVSEQSISVDSFEAAKSIEVFNYNTSYGVNRVVQEQERNVELPAVNAKASITDSMQVDAGQTITKRFAINASLESVKQPEPVSAIFPLPYVGSQGQYVVVGNDDLPIEPLEWVRLGGSLTVSLTENPNEIEITVVAPPSVQLPTAANPAEATNAPYKIGVETSGGEDYPAIYIVGTGVFFKKTSRTFVTGASSDYTSKSSAMSIDNPFIINDFNQSTRGVAAAQVACGPTVSLSQSVVDAGAFGETPGKMQVVKHNKYRAISASYGPGATNINSVACARISDFNSIWSGKKFSDFTAKVFDSTISATQALKFNEFTVIPLLEA